MKPFANFIGGQWVTSLDATQNINPSDARDVVGEYSIASTGDVAAAGEAARSALRGRRKRQPMLVPNCYRPSHKSFTRVVTN